MTFKVVAFLKLPKLPKLSILPTLFLLSRYSFSPLSISPPPLVGWLGVVK